MILFVGPLQLHGVTINLFELPRADVSDLALGVIVPTCPRDRVSDRASHSSCELVAVRAFKTVSPPRHPLQPGYGMTA
jgi:hypothetical protein